MTKPVILLFCRQHMNTTNIRTGPFEHAPWLNVFGRATLETTQRIQAAEAARKMVVEPASPSTPAADLMALTGMSGLSATYDTPTFLGELGPGMCGGQRLRSGL